MLLFAGLGNPGPGYAGHRHNIGFMAADAIARRYSFAPWRRKFHGEFADGEITGTRILLLKPLTYMNLSGQSVGAALHFYKLGNDSLTVFYDELDLPLGRLRVKTGGSASHNGMRDIVAHLGPDFRRVRIGIDHPGDKNLVEFYVLQNFAKADHPVLEKLLDAIAIEVPHLVAGKDALFMNRVALAMNPPPPKPKPEPGKPETDA